MRTILEKISDVVSKHVIILSQILKVNVEIIDEALQVISSTEQGSSYRRNEAHVYRSVLASGEKKIIDHPGGDPICQFCPTRADCRDTFEMHTPIKLDQKVIGVICFSCREESQKQYILENFETLTEFIDQISDLISLKAKEALEKESTLLFIDVLNRVIDQVEQGILITSEAGVIVKANRSAIRSLSLDEKRLKQDGVPVKIREDVNQNEYRVTVNGKGSTLIGELYALSTNDSDYHTVFMFHDRKDLNRKAVELTSTMENLGLDSILGVSEKISSLKNNVKKIAGSSSTVLITGPSGTGKELFARAIHRESGKNNDPFVAINCAAIPDTLLESELFGYVKGAFTGADPKGKIGKIELANNGVLFLDEIGDMPLYIQAKVLRVLEQREVVRLGSNTPVYVNARFIAATNKNLEKLIAEKKFREDLYYRLNVIPFSVPALKERKEDIPVLTDFFVDKYGRLFHKTVREIHPALRRRLEEYEWPGNVRELENTVEYLINMMEEDGTLREELLPEAFIPPENELRLDRMTLEQLERACIQNALREYGRSYKGKIKAAEGLGVGVATLYRKLKKYDLES